MARLKLISPQGLITTVAEITGTEPCKFLFKKGQDEVEAFVLEFNGEIRGYMNMCMHQPILLDLRTGKLWNKDRTEIKCKNHGASFEPLEGACTGGPCPDTYLKRAPIRIDDGKIYLDR